MDACFSCFSPKRSGDDREPLLPKRQPPQPQTPQSRQQPPDEPLRKLADVLAALSTGKLPSQTQINNFLRWILHSNILQESQDAQSRATPDIRGGNGPLSKRGRKVIQDVAHVIEAFLQFGLEKNDDDLLQDLFYQLSQVETDESPISLEAPGEASTKVDVDQVKEQAGKAKEEFQNHVPHQSEVSQDARTMVKALKSLFTTLLTSSVFRLILADAISIGRELVAHVASDVRTAVLHVHDIAEDVEHKAEEDDFGRGAGLEEEASLKEITTLLIEKGKAAASDTAQDAKESMKERKGEWEEHVIETEEEVKRKLLTRIQGMVVRAQEDPSSRRAIIAILQISRKYTHKFALASQDTVENVREAVAKPYSEPEKPQPGGSGEGISVGFADPSSYPPQPYGPPPKVVIPGIEIDSPHLQHVLQDAKVMLERLAQGHKIDDMMKTFGDIVKHSVTAPRGLGKNLEKLAQEKLHYEWDESSSTEAMKHTEHTLHEPPPSAAPSGDHDEEDVIGERANLFSMYFSSVGRYLDRALTRPGWATSQAGKNSLGTLYDATQELLRVAGEVVADAEDVVRGSVDWAKDFERAERELKEAEEGHSVEKKRGDERDHPGVSAEEKAKQDVHRVADQWVQDIAKFLKQAGEYVDAIERDRTTMKLARSLEDLREDTEDLFGAGRQKMARAAGKLKTKLQQHARASGTGKLGLYTQWLGWVLPRLLHLLPLGAIPVPRVEIQTDSVECAIDALWIRGLAFRNTRSGGRYGAVTGREDHARESRARRSNEGIGGKLVPDEILVRQWTEVRVSLAEGLGAAAIGLNDAQYRLGLIRGTRNKAVPGIEATSRMRVRMDGIKSCARGMGYYFKYTGPLLEYEDEGVLSIDLGTTTGGGRHSGFGLDVELEMDKGDVEMDLQAVNPVTDIPILIIEDVDTVSGSDSDFDPDVPSNLDIQEAIYEAGHPSKQQSPLQRHNGLVIGHRTGGASKLSTKLALESVIPLFRVLNVRVDVRGVKFQIDKSRHWMVNKLVVEPFAGPWIRTAAKHALEEKIQRALEAMSSSMALIMMEAKERAVSRRTRSLSLRESQEPSSSRGGTGKDRHHVVVEVVGREEEEEEEGEMKFSDLYPILLERGPEILAYYTGNEPGRSTERHTEFTRKGVVFTSQTHPHTIHHQPAASSSMIVPPVGLTDDEGSPEDFALLREQEREWEAREREWEEEMEGNEDEQQIRVAVGTGPQLFPGKGGADDVPKDTKSAGKVLVQEAQEGAEQVRGKVGKVREGYQRVKGQAQEGDGSVKGKEREREDWRSSAFDF